MGQDKNFNEYKEYFTDICNCNITDLKTLDRKYQYLKYQKEPLILNSIEEITNINIINFLEQMGFSLDERGTYLYSDVITKLIFILDYLDKNDFFLNDLKKEHISSPTTIKQEIETIPIEIKEKTLKTLNDPFSYFYSSLAIEQNEINITRIHNYITRAILKIDKEKNKYNIIPILSNCDNKDLNYGELAFLIANYIKKYQTFDYLNKENNNKELDIAKLCNFKEKTNKLRLHI